MAEIGLFSITELKGELDAALIQLEVKQGLPHHDLMLSRVRDAGDKLFAACLQRKYTTLSNAGRNHQDILRERAEVGAHEPSGFPR